MNAAKSKARNFFELVGARWRSERYVCVGLDIDQAKIPSAVIADDVTERFLRFGCAIVDATHEHAAAFKPNLSFFEALGAEGIDVLRQIIEHIRTVAPDIPVIADAKRADIASTNDGYVHAIFDWLGADAVTLHPYLGHEALSPFLKRTEKGCFILCRTSNPGAGEIQDLEVDGEPLFLRLATLVDRDWNGARNCGLVAGATYPAELEMIRRRVPEVPLLIPGVGAQGGEVERTVRSALDEDHELRAVINSSRAILYPSSELHDQADFAGESRGVRTITRLGDQGGRSQCPAAMNGDAKRVTFGPFLNHAAVDRAFIGSGAFTQSGWHEGGRVLLDLESTEYVDYAAAARAVTLVEGLVRAGRSVAVLLPNSGRRATEDRFLETRFNDLPDVQRDGVRRALIKRINSRRRANSFIRHIGFLEALSLRHLPEHQRSLVSIINSAVPDREPVVGSNRSVGAESGSNVVGGDRIRTFPAILPLQWVTNRSEPFEEGWQLAAIEFLFEQELVVTRGDAESLVTTVFRELIENVLDHGGDGLPTPPGALFGAITLNRIDRNYRVNIRDSYPSYNRYLGWLADQDSPIVRVVVADSGRGLVETLRSAMPRKLASVTGARRSSPSSRHSQIITHAFEPMVSSKSDPYRRGVGLTIVRRFVRSYRGLVSVRSSNVTAGFECHDTRPQRIEDLELHYAPGTSIELYFGLALRNRARLHSDGTSDALDLKDLLVLEADGKDHVATLTKRTHNLIEASAEARLPIVAIQLEGWSRDRDERDRLAEMLRELAESLEGHAALCAVLDAASDVDCDTVFRTMDELDESANIGGQDAWHPPFLVLSAAGLPLWSGGNPDLRKLLYRLLDGEVIELDSPEVLALNDLARSYLIREQDWFVRHDARRVSLRVSPHDFDRAVAAELERRLRHSIGVLSP